MLNFFSLPIGFGIICGVLFPYQSLSLIGLSSIFLFLLLFLNTLAILPKDIKSSLSQTWSLSLLSLGLIFGFFPICVAAAAKMLIKDQDFAFGLVVCSLAPCALVNPFFAKLRKADPSLSLATVILSTLLCPFLTVPLLRLLGFSTVFLDSQYMVLYLAGLTLAPVVLSLAVGSLWPRARQLTNSFLPPANSLLLAALMFILVGSSISRLPTHLLKQDDLIHLILLFLVIDFGLYILTREALRPFVNSQLSETIALSVSSRNFAVSANLMLIFHPKAALPAAIGLGVHALFFQFLTWKRSRLATVLFLLVGFIGTPQDSFAKLNHFVPVKIRFCIEPFESDFGSLVVLAAQDLGYFSRNGIAAEIKNSRDLNNEMTCDLRFTSFNAEASPLYSSKKFSEVMPFAIVVTQNPFFLECLFVPTQSASYRLLELKDQTVRVSSISEQTRIEKIFKTLGSPPPRIKVEPDPGLALKGLLQGNYAAISLKDPWAGALTKSSHLRRVCNQERASHRQAITSLGYSYRSFFESPLNLQLKISSALIAAAQYLDENPSESYRIALENSKLLLLKDQFKTDADLNFIGQFISPQQLILMADKKTQVKWAEKLANQSPSVANWLRAKGQRR